MKTIKPSNIEIEPGLSADCHWLKAFAAAARSAWRAHTADLYRYLLKLGAASNDVEQTFRAAGAAAAARDDKD